ncbi:MAG: cation:proton antiporter, partial [Victivallales bacterium]
MRFEYIFIAVLFFFTFPFFSPFTSLALDKFDKQQAMEVMDAASVQKTELLEKTDIMDAPMQRLGKESIIDKFPPLVKFMIGMTILLLAPAISRRCKLPDVVGLILAGIIFGPFVFGLGRGEAPIISTFSEIGKLLLLFFAGMEIDLVLFGKSKWRTSFFGTATLVIPLLVGTFLGLAFGYGWVSAILIGSLLAS